MRPVRPRGIVLGWMPYSQRSGTLAGRLGFELVLLPRRGRGRRWTAVFAYGWLALRTAIIVLRRRPAAVIVVAPPFPAPLIVVPLARLVGARVAIDVHSGAVLDRRWTGSGPLLRAAARMADAAIVTLPELRDRVRPDALVVPDPVPRIQLPEAVPVEPKLVVAVCGWAPDEPIDALLASASGQAWTLAVTGSPGRARPLPGNVRLTGHLPPDEYHRLLASAACVVVLTTREHTLLSGVWEVLAVGRPLVTSDTRALRRVLDGAARFSAPNPESIGAAINAALADPTAELSVQALAKQLRAANDAALEHLRDVLAPQAATPEARAPDRGAHEPPEGL